MNDKKLDEKYKQAVDEEGSANYQIGQDPHGQFSPMDSNQKNQDTQNRWYKRFFNRIRNWKRLSKKQKEKQTNPLE